MRNHNIETVRLANANDQIKLLKAECDELKKQDERSKEQIELMLDEQGKIKIIFIKKSKKFFFLYFSFFFFFFFYS